jgi:two-component system, LytTR family, sensor kinase
MTTLRAWLAVWAGWTTLALFFAISSSLTYVSTGRSANWTFTIERALSDWWLWALLTPLVAWLARRFPLHDGRAIRHSAVHVGAGIAIALLKTALDRAVFTWLTGVRLYWLASTLALQFAIYVALVAAAHGVGYYRRSREREQLEAQLADTRLRMLNMQLQPHFLFNTLNTIAEMVHEDPAKADAMIAGLSDLLRRTLDLGATQDVPLGDELDLVMRYVDIQRTRFGSRLDVRVDAAPEALDIRVPPLLLQPLVENAIRHGLAARLDAGRIDIDAHLAGSSLVIVVSDDGVGEAEDMVAGSDGVGLSNTRARLETLYGGGATLRLEPAAGAGTRVTIEIPR